ncbi:peptidase M13 [Polaribacter pacificus]|uniref:Peptidase M13 n=1 Tax=Polaribacter pacificus TaxID=1775173 RepID=A0A917HZW1_9FLAO|nr:M13 family metallopeptidase [Polaribacter pacificus]GGG98446.1 peptidase M13 [Polaribacter pacificus]
MKKLLYFSLLVLLIASCKTDANSEKNKFDFDGITASIKPGDNFFEHVNKQWLDNAVIADDQVGVGSYSFLNIPQKKLLENILTEVASGIHPEGSIEQKVGDFYRSGMDVATINQRGYQPIKPILQEIETIKNVSDLMNFVTKEISTGNTSIISMGVSPDNENSSINILHFGQAGLGLPDRDFYFKTDSVSVAIQKAYQEYLSSLFTLSESKNAANNAATVYAIEKKLAAAHKTRIERRNVKANYNKMTVASLNKSQTNIGWSRMLQELHLEATEVDIKQPAYYKTLNSLLVSIPISEWKTYLKASTLANYSDILSKDFEDANFEYAKVLYGQSSQQTRAQLMVQKVDRQLGFALGQLYVKRYFNEAAKKRVLDLVNNLQKAFENRINELDWMSDITKQQAKEKLYAITKKIGYPDVWRAYDVKINKDTYFENVLALNKNQYQYQANQLNKAPNKDRWGTTPSTVTAYYNPPLNEIVFPAGILQFPYFDVDADDAINYGGIGMVIGHELTHAFDDQGAQFDKDGNVKNWWTDEDFTKFKAKTQQMIDRYSSFTVLEGLHLQGALTVGENTADNGGISIAYDAFKLTEQGKGNTKIQGFTPDQRFFMSIARIWRVKTRDAYLRNYIKTNSHSPPVWRVNGPLMNFTPFYTAFDVQPGDKNYKATEERIKIW